MCISEPLPATASSLNLLNLALPDLRTRRIRVRHTPTGTEIEPRRPSARGPPAPGQVDLAYHVAGSGPVVVVFVPGMCVSHEMWHNQVRHLRTRDPHRYTLLLPDPRGTGSSRQRRPSQRPPATKRSPTSHHRSACHSDCDLDEEEEEEESVDSASTSESENTDTDYSIVDLARDVWAVVDAHAGPTASVHLVGHSMGSMVVQRAALLSQRARARVASLAVLGGHDGGWFWRFVPTVAMVRAALQVLGAGFEPAATAAAFLRLHYTARYLDGWTVCPRSGQKRTRRDVFLERYVRDDDDDEDDEEEDEEDSEYEEEVADTDSSSSGDESLDDGENDATAPNSKRKSKAKAAAKVTAAATAAAAAAGKQEEVKREAKEDRTFWRHLAAARMHGLTAGEAGQLRELGCPKLAVYGRGDRVVLPRASRELAARIGADVVGVDAAHFLFDEAAADVNRLLHMHLERAVAEASQPQPQPQPQPQQELQQHRQENELLFA